MFASLAEEEQEQQNIIPQDDHSKTTEIKVDQIVIQEAVDPRNVAEAVPAALEKAISNFGANQF